MQFSYLLLVFLLFHTISTAQIFNGSSGTIPDNNAWTTFSVDVSDVGIIDCDIIVCLNITHTWTADLDIQLMSPYGTIVELSSDNGGSANNYYNTCFDMSASTNITNGIAPFIGSYVPEGDLSTFDGQIADGVWSLIIRDDAWQDSGSLNSWSIEFDGCTNTGENSGCTDSTAVNYNPSVSIDDGSCMPVLPFCTDSTYIYPASVDVPNLGNGPDYDCLYTTPNPAWYYLQISESGNLVIDMHSDPPYDIDFIVWGPLNQYSGVFNSLNDVVDCSYSASGYETAVITNAQVGEIYIFLITNYSNEECNIVFEQTGGDGATDCSIVECNHNAGVGTSLEFCDNDGVFNLFDALQGNPDSTGTWQPSLSGGFLGAFDPSSNSSGTYSYTVTDCDVSELAFVNVNIIGVDAGENNVIELCDTDDPINLFDFIPGNPNLNGSWSPVLPNGYLGLFDPSLNLSGIYTYTITNGVCLDNSITEVQTFTVSPTQITYD